MTDNNSHSGSGEQSHEAGQSTPTPFGAGGASGPNPFERDSNQHYDSSYGQAPAPSTSPFSSEPAASQPHPAPDHYQYGGFNSAYSAPPAGTGGIPTAPGSHPWAYASMPPAPLQSPVKNKRRWSTPLLGLTASLSLILGGIIGVQLDTLFGSDNASGPTQTQESQPRQTPQLTPNNEQGEEQIDPGQQTQPNTGLEGGTVVDSAPGVVLINTLLYNGAGAGTGMILDENGLVLTNYHVVSGSETVQITIADTGEEYKAEVIGHDATADVAVLQIENAKDLPTVTTNTTQPQMGDVVSAVGNGSGQGFLTQLDGSVIGLNETITASDEVSSDGEVLTGLIATDADVVPGYSGGPLFNKDGEVIGMTTAASRGNSSSEVDGYAVPISDALNVVDQVVSGNPTSDSVVIGKNAALGVTVAAGNTPGARVVEVLEDSAADRAGIVADETIVALDGTAINDSGSLSALVKEHSIGDVVTLTVIGTDNSQRDVQVTLGESTVN